MSKARLVITAVTVEKRPVSEVARSYGAGCGKSWPGRGWTPGRRPSPGTWSTTTSSTCRPRPSPLPGPPRPGHPGSGQAAEVVLHPVRCRDAEPVLAGRLPRYPLASGTGTEILTWLDDHFRCALPVTAHSRVTGPAAPLAFRAACAQHGVPASTLTGNGMAFTTRLAGGKGGHNALEHELRGLRAIGWALSLRREPSPQASQNDPSQAKMHSTRSGPARGVYAGAAHPEPPGCLLGDRPSGRSGLRGYVCGSGGAAQDGRAHELGGLGQGRVLQQGEGETGRSANLAPGPASLCLEIVMSSPPGRRARAPRWHSHPSRLQPDPRLLAVRAQLTSGGEQRTARGGLAGGAADQPRERDHGGGVQRADPLSG
jgi:hypothetical protein